MRSPSSRRTTRVPSRATGGASLEPSVLATDHQPSPKLRLAGPPSLTLRRAGSCDADIATEEDADDAAVDDATLALFATVKNRLPMPSARPQLSVAIQPIVCIPFATAEV